KEDVSQEEAQPVRETKQAMHNLDIDIKHQNISLNELMREVNVTPEEVEAQEKEKLSDLNTDIIEIKEDIKQAEKNPEKISQVKEEIEKIKSEAAEIMESKEESKSTVKNDMFKDEKKIDLAKVFNYKNRSSR
ncbi:MAG: hypothetical protein V1831_00440, partial [Candidatus Woesearchaeota archaeon]